MCVYGIRKIHTYIGDNTNKVCNLRTDIICITILRNSAIVQAYTEQRVLRVARFGCTYYYYYFFLFIIVVWYGVIVAKDNDILIVFCYRGV